jgi:hypothetical protein
MFLRKYHDSKAVSLKEYYDYSPIFTYTERSRYFRETIVTVRISIYRKQERTSRPWHHCVGDIRIDVDLAVRGSGPKNVIFSNGPKSIFECSNPL